MKRTSLIVTIVVLMSLMFVGLRFLPEARATTLYVGGTGPGNYTTIQAAIDDANPGNTVYVFNGTYYENVIVNKTISLLGEGSSSTIIDGSAAGDVVYVYSRWVNITGFTIRNGGPTTYEVGMLLWYSRNCRITDNVFASNVGNGLEVVASPNCVVVGNTAFDNLNGFSIGTSGMEPVFANNTAFSNREHGIILDSAFVQVLNNNASENGEYGIYFDSARYNTVVNNTVSFNRYGIVHSGSADNEIKNNTITFNTEAGVLWTTFSSWTGNNISSNGPYGILMPGSIWSYVANNTISDNMRGIYLDGSENNTISHNTVSSNYSTAIRLWESNNNRLEGNVISSYREYGIYVGESKWNVIANNTVSAIDNGIGVLDSDNTTVVGNNISDARFGISVGFSRSGTLSRNKMVGNGIWVWGGFIDHWNTHTIDTLNTVNGKPIYYVKNAVGGTIPSGAGEVILANCSDMTVENQNVSDGSVGIELGFSSNNTIMNNTASNGEGGIVLYDSHSNSIENSSFISNEYSGIQLEDSDSNTIAGSLISGSQNGVVLFHSSDDNTIIGNDVRENGCGICLDSSHGSAILNNTVLGNELGILTDFDTVVAGNTILTNLYGVYVSNDRIAVYHNDIISNAIQAYDSYSNLWDNGYPSGGNYWSDYLGVDNCSGPNQDICPDPDGIGDTPYVIDGDSRDRYPLMSPSGIVPPRPPKVLRAVLSGSGFKDITLDWSLSPDDGAGLESVVGYEIRRDTMFDKDGIGYVLLASVSNGTSSFVDTNAGEGDTNNYFYRVCAVAASNHTTCARTQAGKFTRPLSKGPNLVSIPLIQSNESIETVLQTVRYDKVWHYDSFSQEWKWFMKSKGYRRGLWSINHTMGLWINVTEDSSLTVAGIVPAQTTIHLYEGWNLVSFPSFSTSYRVANLKMETGATRVEGYDLAPPHFLRVLGGGELLLAGEGYWVRVNTDTDWMVEIA